MSTINTFKLKTELLALKARLAANAGYDKAVETVEDLKKRIEDNDTEKDIQDAKEDYKEKMDSLIDKLRNKSADSLNSLEQLINDVENRLRG